MPSVPIAATKPYRQYLVAAPQTVFEVPYQFFVPTDLEVYLTPFTFPPNDIADILAINADYTVTQNFTTYTGIITLTNPANVGDIVTIVRNMPNTRANLYIQGGALTADALNTDFSSEVLMIQQDNYVINNIMPRYQFTETPLFPNDIFLPVLNANQIWVKDPTGTFIQAVTLPTIEPGVIEVLGTVNQIDVTTVDQVATVAISPNYQITQNSANHGTNASNTTFWRGDNTWVEPEGSGTINPGTTGSVAYYPADGIAISPLPTRTNGLLLTDAFGQALISNAVSVGLTILGGQLTVGQTSSIRFNSGMGILDQNLEPMLTFNTVALAFNHMTLSNAPVGGSPTLSVEGSNPNIPIKIQTKGTAGAIISGATDASFAGVGYVGEVAAAEVSSNPGIFLSPGVITDILSIVLSPGDWDIQGSFSVLGSMVGTPNITAVDVWLNTVSMQAPGFPGPVEQQRVSSIGFGSTPITVVYSGTVPSLRINLATSQTVYLSCVVVFPILAVTASGVIRARRMR